MKIPSSQGYYNLQGQTLTGAHDELQITCSVGTRLGIDFDDNAVE